jgi:hypothetical protein
MSVYQMARFIGSRVKEVSKYNTLSLNKHENNFAFIQREIIHIISVNTVLKCLKFNLKHELILPT